MTSKPMRQIRSPKGRGTISSAIIRKAVKKVAEERERATKKKSRKPTAARKK